MDAEEKVRAKRETNPCVEAAFRLFGKRLRLPKGWRWLKVGEFTLVDDVLCDVRAKPVRQVRGGQQITENHHPIRRRESLRTPAKRKAGRTK